MKPHRVALAFLMTGLAFTGRLLANPSISVHPSDATIVIGNNTSFGVTATGNGSLAYQWQGSTDGGTTWNPITSSVSPPFANFATATLNVNAPAYLFNGAKVRCVVTDLDGSTTSNVATLTINTPAPALILASPTNKPAFQGDVSPTTFLVWATGTGLSYQWQVSDNNGTFANLSDNATYSGCTSATLSIADPYGNLGGTTASSGHTYRYRCTVTSSTGPYSVNSRPATLNIYATPTATPSVTLKVGGTTASSIASNDPSVITVQVSGVPSGGAVRIGRYGDVNGNNAIDPGEPLVQSFFVTDGAVTSYGGVTDPDIPGDSDLTADGTVIVNFYLAKSAELARGAGSYIFRIASPTGAFKPFESSVFTVTQPTLAHTISGTVTDGTNPVPYAQVALLASGGNGDFVSAVVADTGGNFTLQAAVGSYQVLAMAPGYVTNMATAPTATVTTADLTGLAPTLTPAAYMHTVTLVDQASPSLLLRGAQIFFQSGNYVTLASTDNNGVAVAGAVAASDWTMDISSSSLTGLGYVRPQFNNGIPLNAVFLQYPLRAANAMIHGTLTDNAGTPNPLPNVNVNASDQTSTYSADTLTDATGHYYLPIYTTGTSNWNVQVNNQDPVFAPTHVPRYLIPANQNFSNVASGSANQANFVATVATASLSGTVTKLGVPQTIPLQLDLYRVAGITTFAGSVTTDGSGNFNFGITAGTWIFYLSNSTNNGTPVNPTNIVGPVLQHTVNNGDNITGIDYQILDSTGTINGTVTDFNGAPLSNANVAATATISTVVYTGGAQTDGSGHYSFPTIAGSWTVNANWSNLMFPQAVVAAGAGSNVQNFSPTVFFYQPGNQSVTSGSMNVGFNTSVNAPGGGTMQWQMSTDGGGSWGPVPNSFPYNGVTTNALTITQATIGMDGHKFRLAVSFTYNSQANTVYSNTVTLNVSGTAPTITSQPMSATITATGGTSFVVGAYGTPTPSYQWQLSTDGGSTFSNLSDNSFFSGTQTTSLVVNGATTTLNGYKFRCVLSNGVAPDAISDVVTLTVNANTTVFTFNDATISLNTATDLSLLASVNSGMPITFSALSSNTTYTLVGTTLTITAPGYVVIEASAPSNDYYYTGSKNATFTVNKLAATVTLGSLSPTYDGSPKSASATTNPNGLTVNFTYTPPGDSTAPTNAGSYTVVGTINDTTYQGSATDTLVIAKAGQTITFAGPGDQTYSATPIPLSASGGGSGNPVTFSLDSGPASLSGTNNSTLTMTGTGTVVVRASQAGSSNYNVATDVVRSFVVSAAATGFSAWRNSKFTAGELLDANISGPNAVYGQDGLPNLVKYALGLEPKQNITTGLPVVSVVGSDWVYTYTRPDTITDVTYAVEVSTNLTTWTTAGVTHEIVSNSGGIDTWRGRYALASATNVIFRLKVTQP